MNVYIILLLSFSLTVVDHLYLLRKDVNIGMNPEEVMETRWVDPTELRVELAERPELYTPWFKAIAYDLLLKEDSVWNHIRDAKLIHPLQKPLVYTVPL